MDDKTIAIILFVLAAVMIVLGGFVKALPPVITGVGFALIGYYISRHAKG